MIDCICRQDVVVLDLATASNGMKGFIFRCNHCNRASEVCENETLALSSWDQKQRLELDELVKKAQDNV